MGIKILYTYIGEFMIHARTFGCFLQVFLFWVGVYVTMATWVCYTHVCIPYKLPGYKPIPTWLWAHIVVTP